MQTVTKQTLKIYWQHALRYKFAVFFISFTILLTCSIDVLQPFLFKSLFNTLTGDDPNRGSRALVLVWYIFGTSLLAQAIWRLMGYAINRFQPRVMSDLLNTCYEYMLGHSFGFFANNFIGSIVTRVRRFQASFEKISDVLIFSLTRTALRMVFIIGVLFYLKPTLGIMTLMWTLIYLASAYVFTKYKLKYDIKYAEQETKTTAHLADTMTNNVNVKLFTSLGTETRSFHRITEKLYQLRKKAWDFGTHINIFQSMALVFLEFAVMYSAIIYWQKGQLTIGDIVLFQAYLAQIFEQMWDFGRNLRQIYEALADANEMTEMLSLPQEITNAPNASTLKVTSGGIEFVNVNFGYHRESAILLRFNLSIKPGEKVALVGKSGSGKTTIVKLLLRFADIQSGQVLIDGQDIAGVTQESLRGSVSLVPQDPVLFHRTLYDNIRYGSPNATEAEVVKAAKAAHAHEFISKLADGYGTYVGERGVKLSGGERQRVAIARAILKNSPILVLDEATSSLDSESESLIQDALETLMRDRTTIVVAHRLSTIMKMDRIVVMESGRIKEQGSHGDLLKAKQGTYQRLWEIQAGGFAEVAR